MGPSVEGAYVSNDERVLVFLPESRDAESIPRVLERIGVLSTMCATPEEICAELDQGAEALLIDEEAFSPRSRECLVRALARQPPWSELPIIVLLRRGPETKRGHDALLLPGDVTLVERPVRVNTLVAIIRSALRSRRRQYLVRDQLKALDESERRYRTLFNSIDEGFCIIEMIFDRNGKPLDYRFLEVNPSFEEQTGLSNAKGKTMRELGPQTEEHWFEVYGQVALTGQPVRFQNQARELRRWFDVYAFRFGRPQKQQVAILFNDITKRKWAEWELHKAKEELERRVQERTEDLSHALQRLRTETEERMQALEELRRKDELLMQQGRMAAMGEMIGFIAHQWRQPLNTLGLMIQEIPIRYQTGLLDQEFLDHSTSAAMLVIRQMSQTIEDFRNFFKPDKQKASFRIKDILSNTLKLIESSFRETPVQIEVKAEDDAFAEGFSNEFSQVLLNILMNAKDAFLERKVAQPRIEIHIFKEGDQAVTTIADNAGGIHEEALDKIFDAYFTTKGPEKGTGIGLYLARTIIERNMRGRLSARNLKDGAEFRIEISLPRST